MDTAERNTIDAAFEYLHDICAVNKCDTCPLRFQDGQKLKTNGVEHFCFANALQELTKEG